MDASGAEVEGIGIRGEVEHDEGRVWSLRLETDFGRGRTHGAQPEGEDARVPKTLTFAVERTLSASREAAWTVLGDFGAEHRWTKSVNLIRSPET